MAPAVVFYDGAASSGAISLSKCGGGLYPTGMTFRGFDRITAQPDVLGGKPCIRGMRLSVQRVLEILADNPSWDDLRADYPELEREDVEQALAFAAASLADDRIVPLDGTAG